MDFLMEHEKHEKLLSELLMPDLEQSRKTEILQELRTSHTATISGVNDISTKSASLQKHNDDLIVSNSMLFRQAGIVGGEKEDETTELEFSETVTLNDILR